MRAMYLAAALLGRNLPAVALSPLALIAAAPAVAQDRMSESEMDAVQIALNRGTLLYYYDQAAWHGTDDMLTKIGNRRGELGGWVVDGTGDASELVFYDKNAADPHAIYIAKFNGDKLVSGHVLAAGEDNRISPERKRMIAAVATARAALEQSDATACIDKPFNTVVLPPETAGGPVQAYFLTPQSNLSQIPFGLHYSFAIGADGKAGPMRRFTKSCISMPFKDTKDGKAPEALMITHLLDPTPTEIHVFSMFVTGKPVYVVTGEKRLWVVEAVKGQAQIRLVEASGPKKK